MKIFPILPLIYALNVDSWQFGWKANASELMTNPIIILFLLQVKPCHL